MSRSVLVVATLLACTAAWAENPDVGKKNHNAVQQAEKKHKKRSAKHRKNTNASLHTQLLDQSLSTRQFSSLGPAFVADNAENCRTYTSTARMDPNPDHDGSMNSDSMLATRDPEPVPTGANSAKIQAPVKAGGPAKPSGFQLPITQRLNLNLELDLAREVRSVNELQIHDVAARTGLMYRF